MYLIEWREGSKGSYGIKCTLWYLNIYVSYWLKGGEQGDVVAAVLSNSPEYTILFRWVIHLSQRVANPQVWTYSGVAGAGLAMTPINHSFTGPEIAKQVVGPMMGPMRSKTVSVKKCPTSCFVQIEAASSKWVITDSSSKLKIFNALSGICSPAYISVDGGRYLSIVVHWTKFLLRRKT